MRVILTTEKWTGRETVSELHSFLFDAFEQ